MFNNKNYDEDYDSDFYYHKNKTQFRKNKNYNNYDDYEEDYNNDNILQIYYDLRREISSICLLDSDIYEQIIEYEEKYKYLYDGSIRNYIKNQKFIINKIYNKYKKTKCIHNIKKNTNSFEHIYADLESLVINSNQLINLNEFKYNNNLYIYYCDKIITSISQYDNYYRKTHEYQLCYGNNIYYVVFNTFKYYNACPNCGKNELLREENRFFHLSSCRIEKRQYIKQYFISFLSTYNIDHAKLIFNRFSEMIELDNNFYYTHSHKIKLFTLDTILLLNIFPKDLSRYIMSFLLQEVF